MSSPKNPLPPKKDVALALLEGPSVYVHLDPRKPGVIVPAWFKKQPQLVLQVGLNMAIPIPDLRVEDDALTCTLSFSRTPVWCKLPWDAVYALVGEDGRAMLWPDDVPPEVAAQMEAARRKDDTPPKAAKGPRAASTGRKRAAAEPAAANRAPREPSPAVAAVRSDEDAAAPAPPAAAPAARQATSAPGAKKPKRELPPYLRVVK